MKQGMTLKAETINGCKHFQTNLENLIGCLPSHICKQCKQINLPTTAYLFIYLSENSHYITNE
jgi:hypothetical protein